MQQAQHARGWNFLPKLTFVITIGLITAAAGFQAKATDVFTDPVGFTQSSLNTNSDTLSVVPFTQIDAYRGVVGSVSGNTLTDNGTPGWTAGQWTYNPGANQHNTYYVILTSGSDAGAYYIVTNNTSGSLAVELTPTSLASVNPGDTYRIYPFWTLNTVFPNGAGVVASPSTLTKRTEVLFPSISGTGINLAAAATYFFLQTATQTNWCLVGAVPASSNVNDQIILPDQYVTVRQQNNSSTTVATALGQVPTYPIQIPLYTQVGGAQDNYIGLYRPAAQSLAQSGLSNSFVESTQLTHRDQLLVINGGVSQNPAASQTYFFVNPTSPTDSGWRLIGSSPSTADAGSSNVFAIGNGVLIRKVATNVVSTVLWNNLPNY